jgi:hypothetical protein
MQRPGMQNLFIQWRVYNIIYLNIYCAVWCTKVDFSCSNTEGRYVPCFRALPQPASRKKSKKKAKIGPWIDAISVESIEISIKLTKGGKISKRDKNKIEYCIKLWSGELERSNLADHKAAEVSDSPHSSSHTD